jgi:hypothetical protein
MAPRRPILAVLRRRGLLRAALVVPVVHVRPVLPVLLASMALPLARRLAATLLTAALRMRGKNLSAQLSGVANMTAYRPRDSGSCPNALVSHARREFWRYMIPCTVTVEEAAAPRRSVGFLFWGSDLLGFHAGARPQARKPP